jgi:hypothetical protein
MWIGERVRPASAFFFSVATSIRQRRWKVAEQPERKQSGAHRCRQCVRPAVSQGGQETPFPSWQEAAGSRPQLEDSNDVGRSVSPRQKMQEQPRFGKFFFARFTRRTSAWNKKGAAQSRSFRGFAVVGFPRVLIHRRKTATGSHADSNFRLADLAESFFILPPRWRIAPTVVILSAPAATAAESLTLRRATKSHRLARGNVMLAPPPNNNGALNHSLRLEVDRFIKRPRCSQPKKRGGAA